MTSVVFDVSAFRVQFPAFSNATTFPDLTLQMYFDNATVYITNNTSGWCCNGLSLPQLKQALYLLTAHLAALAVLIGKGQTPGILQSATVDKVSVSMTPPPAPNQWQYWLQSTPYGQQLLALLQVAGAGGLYRGGIPARAGFRRIGWY